MRQAARWSQHLRRPMRVSLLLKRLILKHDNFNEVVPRAYYTRFSVVMQGEMGNFRQCVCHDSVMRC